MGIYKTIFIEHNTTVKGLRQKASEAFYSTPDKTILRRCIRGKKVQLGDEMKPSMFGGSEIWRIMNDEDHLCELGIYTESTISVFVRC